MSISEQGMAAIQAYESSKAAAYSSKTQAVNSSLQLMIQHLAIEHRMSAAQIAVRLKIPRLRVKDFLSNLE